MPQQLNKDLRFLSLAKNEHGRVIRLAVDQTPAIAQLKAPNGFFKSDITILSEASENGDKAMFEKFANRLERATDEPDNKKSIAQLFAEWKPAYLQTMSEVQAWPVYLKSTHPDIYDTLYGEDDKAFEASRTVKSTDGDPNVESESK